MMFFRRALIACVLAAGSSWSAWGNDEYRADMDFSSDAAMAKFGFALGWEALTASQTVNWLPGDEFEAIRLHGGAGH
jgi:hypothetical protein